MRRCSKWRTMQCFAFFTLQQYVWATLQCDPSSDVKKADPQNPESYLYCNLEGSFSRRKCVSGKLFNSEAGQCEPIIFSDAPESDPFSQPFFQAPDDLCGSGIPMTILSAPVACNPSIASCPDGYVCRMYERTGTSYCCQNPSPTTDDQNMCSSDQVTYIEPSTGRPRSCVLGSSDSCPVGFGCNLVSGTTTRCCGKDFGCPYNAAGFIHPSTGSHIECNPKQTNACQRGFQCARSAKFNKYICCSSADSDSRNTMCPNGDSPLTSPSHCSADSPCPAGYVCSDEKCCPAIGVCPAGLPLGGGVTVCNENHPCQEGYDCVTTGGAQYCCPKKENVCTLSKHSGQACANTRPAVTRYFFDQSTGSCRSFKYSQCGGNSNNFNSLEECEGFCVDTQCANGQAYRVGAVNAACSMSSLNTCPRQHVCTTPAFGPSPICCPIQELTCNEMVSAGTPCFGRSMTIQRFYFNPMTRKCTPFQFYGCNGNGNNFNSLDQCQDFCLNAVDTACGGVAPLVDPNNRAQKCDGSVGCPDGYNCNPEGYCCPETKTACAATMSRGNVCAGTAQRTMWYYDTAQQKCRQFLYNGCGGSSNRFTSQTICSATCVQASTVGQCPRGMTAFVEKGDISAKSCTLNVRGTCPQGSSCVRSTSNVPICCQTVHSCPEQRSPYNIPGSSSVVACNLENDTCPRGNVCLESSTIVGFHLCCSTSTKSAISTTQQRPQKNKNQGNSRNTNRNSLQNTSGRKGSSSSLASLLGESPCPSGSKGNGMSCMVNAIGACPTDHICLGQKGFPTGTCCHVPLPKCSQKRYMPVFISVSQVQVCDNEEFGCPANSKCQSTNIPGLNICCEMYNPNALSSSSPLNRISKPLISTFGANSIHESSAGRCLNGDRPFRDDMGMVHQCNLGQNSCPGGFKCQQSNVGVSVCCADLQSIRCPVHSTPYEYGGRPLACPPASTKCPTGFSCVPSHNPLHNLCCSDGGPRVPTCASGVAFVDPDSQQRQFCSPISDNCPNGFHCLESTMPGQFICCTQGDLNEKFAGFCPQRQIPHVDFSGRPSPCHMSLKPCPNNAPYVCIYSAEKQDSFCCAPVDSSARQYHPSVAYPGQQMNKLTSFPGQSVPNYGVSNSNQNLGNGFNGQMIDKGIITMNNFQNQSPLKAVPSIGVADIERKEMEKGRQLAQMALQQQKIIEEQRITAQHKVNGVQTLGAGLKSSTNGSSVTSQWQVVGGETENTEYEKAMKLGEEIGNKLRLSSHSSAGCPAGSRALVGSDRNVVRCETSPCPGGFACLFADEVNRWQCCSTNTNVSPISNGQDTNETSSTSPKQECPYGFYMIDGKCLKVLYVGQKGCISDDQCSSREANATCDSGYCICPAGKPLVHESKCVASCPEGFSNIAGRCYDPTTVIFMDSVDERNNGTIGGYCMETLIEEKRCLVKNSYCTEKTVTCTCKPGYELKMDFQKKDDKGECEKLASTKFDDTASETASMEPIIDDELYFIDITPQSESTDNNSELLDSPKTEDFGRYLLPQTEEAIPVLA